MPFVTELLGKARAAQNGSRVAGIDLTGSERRASGWALFEHGVVTTARLKSDADIVRRTLDAAPDVVSIDAPLSLPGGFADVDDCKRAGLPPYRASELALRRIGIPVFWCLLPSMQALTLRGIALARTLRAAGLPVIESYPGAAQDLLRIPRKRVSLEDLRRGLHAAGVEGLFSSVKTSHDELDAITAALVGLAYLADDYIALGNSAEEYLVIPRSPRIDYDRLTAIVQRCGLDAVDRRAVGAEAPARIET